MDYQDECNLTTISEFLNSEVWEKIVDEAVYDKDPDSIELMEDIMLRMSSAEFFLNMEEHSRHEREVEQLATISKEILS